MPETEDDIARRNAADRVNRQHLRNLAAAWALVSSIAMGIGIQGAVKGGSARTLGVIVLALGLLVGIKSANVASNLSHDNPLSFKHRPGWLRYSIGDADRQGPLTFAAAIAVVVMAAFGVRLNSRPTVNYRSAYDGVDPVHAQCAVDSRGDGKAIASEPIRTGTTLIGTLELEYSEFCGSHWARLVLTPAGLRAVRGTTVDVSVHRPADDTVANYSLVVEDVPYMWGNMVGGGVCAYAEVQDTGERAPSAPLRAQTACRDT